MIWYIAVFEFLQVSNTKPLCVKQKHRNMQTQFCTTVSMFLISIAMIFFSSPTSVSAQDDYRYRNCSASFQCGNLTDIGYPFFGGDRPSYCGYPGFELTNCSTPVINITGLTYQVLEIFNETRTVKVARTDYTGNVCPTSFRNTTLNNTLFDFSSDSDNITIYYGCTQPFVQGQFSCNNNVTGTANYFLTPNMATAASSTISLLNSCSNRVYVPAYETNIASLESNPSEENLVSTLDEGFGLGWKAENSLCETCRTTGGLCGYNDTTASFVCLCHNRTEPFACASLSGQSGTGKKSRRELVIGLSIAAGAAIVIIPAAWFFYLCFLSFWRDKTIGRGRKNKNHKQIEAIIRNYDSLIPKRYSYSEIKKMTDSFKEKLGEGGFGSVYKGKLQNGETVAVKISRESKGDGTDFINEIASFCRTSHVNVIKLEGFCYEKTKRALIYEYMPNGSLDKFISDQRSPPYEKHFQWDKLYEIVIGIARGLEYLHRGCSTRIVHFDIKPHNILLDKDFSPKISDFGLAKLSKTRDSRVSMLDARGTIGYIAPEVIYRHFGEVSYRADVYSYGMMVLEIIGARNRITVDTSEAYFPDWIYDRIESGGVSRLHEILAGENAEDLDDNNDNDDEERIKKMAIVGLWCIQMNPSDRPSMTKVVEMLEGSLQFLRVPPRPVLYPSATTLPSTYSSTTSQSTTTIPSEVEETAKVI